MCCLPRSRRPVNICHVEPEEGSPFASFLVHKQLFQTCRVLCPLTSRLPDAAYTCPASSPPLHPRPTELAPAGTQVLTEPVIEHIDTDDEGDRTATGALSALRNCSFVGSVSHWKRKTGLGWQRRCLIPGGHVLEHQPHALEQSTLSPGQRVPRTLPRAPAHSPPHEPTRRPLLLSPLCSHSLSCPGTGSSVRQEQMGHAHSWLARTPEDLVPAA